MGDELPAGNTDRIPRAAPVNRPKLATMGHAWRHRQSKAGRTRLRPGRLEMSVYVRMAEGVPRIAVTGWPVACSDLPFVGIEQVGNVRLAGIYRGMVRREWRDLAGDLLMRHARRNCGENLCHHARIATGGHRHAATHGNRAPGRTYSQIARRRWLENLITTARDRSPATLRPQPIGRTPGSPYSNSLAFGLMETFLRSPARGADDE